MSEFGNVAFDPEALATLEGVFDEAWASIQAQRNGNITRAALAERILNLAVKGERNPARLLDGALSRSKTDVERERLEKALEEGLREPFLLQMLLLSFSLRRPNHTTCEGWNLALPVAGEFLSSRASKLSSFMHRPQSA